MIEQFTSPVLVNNSQELWLVGEGVVVSGGVAIPSLDLDFIGTDTLNSSITFTRASTATFFNSAGVLTSASNNVARFDYNPATLAARGLLIEEQRTNSIRNNTMQGAVAGTPGTLPTNWGNGPIGLTRTIVGTGTENGITYIDVRFNGTTSAQFGNILFELNNNVAAASGQAWVGSAYVKLVGGSLTNIAEVGVALYYWSSIPTFISVTPTPAPVSSTLTRFFSIGTAPATTAFIQSGVYFNATAASGQAVDFTLRIGLPQLEQGAFATSVIPTTTTALTRSADVASVNTLSPWFNATAGTFYAETQLLNTVAQNRAGFDLNDGGTNNRNIFRAFTTGSADQNVVRSGGSTVASLAAATNPTTAVRKSAAAYAVNDFAFTADGGIPATDTLGAVPVGLTTFLLGSAVAGTEYLNGYLRRVTFYPRRLSNAELQAITV